MSQELKYNVNLSFVVFNLLQDIFLNIKYEPEIKHEFKQSVNSLLSQLQKFNKLAENVFTDEVLDSFDADKRVLLHLCKTELIAHTENKQTEFLEYINKFFEK